MYTMPKFCTVDGATEICDKLEGVTLPSLEACDTIHVRTHNHDYEIFLLDPESGRALVEGGRFFVEPTEATVVGSTFGGCIIKLGWIGIGLRLEINLDGQPIITSQVQAISVEHETEIPIVDAEPQSQLPS